MILNNIYTDLKHQKTKLVLLLLTLFASFGVSWGQFTPGRLVVLQVGDGSAALSATATPIFLKEFTTAGGAGISVALNMPNTLTSSGSATSEGLITRSSNGQSIIIPGYNAAAGTAAIASTATSSVPRGIGQVTSGGVYSLAATTTSFSTNNIRGATSDGTNFWASGSNTGIVLASSGAGTIVSSTSTNTRSIAIFNGQLYFSTGGGTRGIYAVGTGLPTNSGNTSTILLATGASSSPYQFSFNAANTVCYIADDASVANGGGIQKWTFNGTVWSLAYVLNTTACRGLTVDYSNANATTGTGAIIYATTSSSSSLISMTDGGVAGATLTTLATAPANTAFRGVAFAPVGPGVTITQSGGTTNVTEGGATDTYDAVLNSQPTADVTVTITNGTQTSTNSTSLTFTTANWNVAQTVTVTAVDDAVIEGPHTGTISHTVASSDLNYNGTSVASVTANITDNDAPSLTINDVSQIEGNSGTTTFTFTVSLSAPAPAGGVTFDIATANGTAIAPGDYTANSLTNQSISAGDLTFKFDVSVNGDATPETNKTFFVNVTNVTGAFATDGQGLGTILNDDIIYIRDIQGAAHISPLLASATSTLAVANVPGIVTAKRSNGFYIQDPSPDADEKTSEGIFVFTSTPPTVTVGDAVTVTGTVTEFRPGGGNNLTITEITNNAAVQTLSITTVSSGNALPAPILIGTGGRAIPTTVIDNDAAGSDPENPATPFDPGQDGIDFYESLEGMRVQINNAVAVSPTNNFGEVWVLTDNGANAVLQTSRGGIVISASDYNPERIQLDDVLFSPTPMPVVNVGASFNGSIVGLIDYNSGNYELLPTTAPTATAGSLAKEVTTINSALDKLTIATFNVENLSPGDGATKFNNLASRIVTNLKSPDIITVEEIQDNTGSSNNGVIDAATTFQTLINAIAAAGGPTYSYRQIDPVNNSDGGEPGGNIRVGFLFNPSRVSFVDIPGGTSTASTTVSNVGSVPTLSASPGRIDPTNTAFNSSRKPLVGQFTFNDETVYVIGNHFNSKGGDLGLFGKTQPPTLSSETQRNQQATIVKNFVQSILSINANANVIVLGDINDFEFSNPVSILESSPLNTLLETLPANERYTYNFEGNAQALDHVLVSNNLLSKLSGFDVVHINSEFADQDSDHDPSLAQFTLCLGPTPSNAGTAQSICGTGSVTLAANNPTLGTGAWSVISGPNTSNSQFSNLSLPTAIFTPAGGAGVYVLRWTITKAPCTPSVSDVSITVHPLPTAVVSGGGTVCVGATLPNVSIALTGTGPWNLTYSNGTTPTNVTGIMTTPYVITGAAVGTYTVTALTDANCTGTSLMGNATVTVHPLPTAVVSGGGTVCADATLPNVSIALTGTGPWNLTYSNGTTPTNVTGIMTSPYVITGAGAGTYTVTALTDANCTGTSLMGNATVTVNPLPTAVVSGGGTVCAGATLPNVSIALTGTGPWNLTYSNGITPTNVTGIMTSPYVITGAGVGTYTVTALADANCTGTSLTGSSTVAVIAKPTITLSTLGQTLNEGNTQILCDTDANPSNSLTFNISTACPAGSLVWRTQIGAGALSAWSASVPSTQPSDNTAYLYQAACDAACPSTYTGPITLTVNYRASTPQNVSLVADGTTVAAGESKTVCDVAGNTMVFSATCAVGETLLYSVDGGDYSAVVPSQIVDNVFHNYRVRCRKADGTPSCVETESAAMSLKITTAPAGPTVSISPTGGCGIPTAFSGSSNCGALTTIWYDAATNQALPTLPTTTPNATTSYYARCQNEAGCQSGMSNTVTFTLTPVNDPPIVTASADIVCAGTQVTLSTTCPAGASVFWNTGVTESSFQVAFNNVSRQTYWAKCIFPNGCQSPESIHKIVLWRAFDLTFINIGQSQSAIKPANDKALWASQFITKDAGPVLENSTEANPTIYYSENLNKTAPRFWTIQVETCVLGTNGSVTYDLLATPETGVVRSYNTHENNAPYFMYANREGFTELYAQNHPAYGFYQNNGSGGNVYDEGFPKGLYKLGVRYWDQKGQGSIYPSTRQPAGNVLAYQEYWFRIQSSAGVGSGAARIATDNGQRITDNGAFAQVMPNPVSNTLRLKVAEAKGQKVNVSLVDASGRTLLQRAFVPQANQHQEEFEVGGLSNGMYFLRVTANDKQTTLKVIKVE